MCVDGEGNPRIVEVKWKLEWPFWKTTFKLLKKLKTKVLYDKAILIQDIHSKGKEINVENVEEMSGQ